MDVAGEPVGIVDDGSIGAVEAAEAAIEGVPGALSLAPSTVMPAIGGELLLPAEESPLAAHPGDQRDLAADSVRAGLLQAGPLAVAGLVANGANVVITIVLARLLSSRGYGVLNQLTGLFLIVSMPGSAVIVAVVRRVAASRANGSAHLVRRWAGRIHRQGTVALVVFSVVVLGAGSWLADLLGQPSAVGAVAILIAGGLWILLSLDRGLLQAHQDYRALAVNLLVEGGVRTVCMLALVLAGFGAAGAAVGVLIAELITALHARVSAVVAWSSEALDAPGATGRPRLRVPSRSTNLGAHWRHWHAGLRGGAIALGPVDERRHLLVDFGAAFVALAAVALLQNIDVIVVGRDAPKLSGSYAAVSVASKALVFGAIILGGYLLPEAAIRWHRGGHALRQLAVTLLLLAVPTVALLALALFAPHLLLTVVFSGRYLGAASALAPLVLAMMCLSVTVILTMYLLAVGRRWITGVLIAGAVALTFVVVLARGAPLPTARADLVVQAALALVTIGGFATVHHRRLGR